MRPGGTIIVNDHKVEPVRMADTRPYPDEGNDFLAERGFDVVVVPATQKAIELFLIKMSQHCLSNTRTICGRGAPYARHHSNGLWALYLVEINHPVVIKNG